MNTQDIRPLVAEHARLLVSIEEHFNVEFLDRMLGRKTFGSIRSLAEAIEELGGVPRATAAAERAS
jgi:hypothetical protein